jgi:DNA-binding transcriptional LysR family regulator
MRDLNDLHLFVAVVAQGGFSAAARALNIPKSRISRRVAALEEDLGVRLVERSTRRFKVTDVGQDVYGHARAAISETEAIDEAVARLKAEPQGLVRVSCPLDSERLLASALPSLLERYPRLRVQFLVSNRRIDIIEEGIDIAVRVRERLDTDADLQVKQLGTSVQMLVASPAFLAQHGSPANPQEIPSFPTLAHTDRPGADRWSLVNATGEEAVITHEPRLAASAFPVLREAAIAGVGIALLPDAACSEALGDGRLVQLLPEWTSRRGIVHLVFTSRRGLLPSVRTMLDFLAEALDPRQPAWTRLGTA